MEMNEVGGCKRDSAQWKVDQACLFTTTVIRYRIERSIGEWVRQTFGSHPRRIPG